MLSDVINPPVASGVPIRAAESLSSDVNAGPPGWDVLAEAQFKPQSGACWGAWLQEGQTNGER